jgi:hypothetical protein
MGTYKTKVIERMISIEFRSLLVGTLLLLPACSLTEESLWPSFTADDPASESSQTASSAPRAKAQPATVPAPPPPQQPALGTSNFVPPGVTSGQNTGTFVGKKVIELRQELQRLQSQISQNNGQLQQLRGKLVANSQRYHGTIAAVNARLQVGTTPGNPILIQQFSSAQGDLDRLSQDVASMNMLSGNIGNSATMSAFLAESAKAAFSVSGAIDDDHRQLAILEDEVNRTDVLIDRLLKEVSNDVRRQTNYVSTERANLNLLSTGIRSGEIYGGSLMNIAMANSGSGKGAYAGAPTNTAGKRPLIVIRFDRDKVAYQQALYNTVSKVLEQRPNATFDLVGVAPTSGGKARVSLNSNKARRHSENVLRSLIEMGLPPSRVAISARTALEARSNEVHLYLR